MSYNSFFRPPKKRKNENQFFKSFRYFDLDIRDKDALHTIKIVLTQWSKEHLRTTARKWHRGHTWVIFLWSRRAGVIINKIFWNFMDHPQSNGERDILNWLKRWKKGVTCHFGSKNLLVNLLQIRCLMCYQCFCKRFHYILLDLAKNLVPKHS